VVNNPPFSFYLIGAKMKKETIKINGLVLANVVERHRNGNGGVSELSSLVEMLSESPLTREEIAQKFIDSFEK
jgi:hypothetical protein